MDPVFSIEGSSYLDDSEDQGEAYTGFSGINSKPVVSSTAVKEENTGKSPVLKKSPKKISASCFFLRKRKILSNGK